MSGPVGVQGPDGVVSVSCAVPARGVGVPAEVVAWREARWTAVLRGLWTAFLFVLGLHSAGAWARDEAWATGRLVLGGLCLLGAVGYAAAATLSARRAAAASSAVLLADDGSVWRVSAWWRAWVASS